MKWVRDNSLTIALLALFAVSVVGQSWAGWLTDIKDEVEHGQPAPGLIEYLGSGA